ncbi:MAG: hypothetical protein KAG56_09205 [Sulfurovaceae bacterium]|nr:hypothetical protein [Sulfurovaceae bacterium]
MITKNEVACFDKAWVVESISLERSDIENDDSIRYTGRDIYGEASITLISGSKTNIINLKNCEPLNQLPQAFDMYNKIIVTKKIGKYLLEFMNEDYEGYTEIWCDEVTIEEL